MKVFIAYESMRRRSPTIFSSPLLRQPVIPKYSHENSNSSINIQPTSHCFVLAFSVSGDVTGQTFSSSGPVMTLLFNTDFTGQDRGFAIHYEMVLGT